MARPTDWQPLGLSGDPVRGDTVTIRASARGMRSVVQRITDQAAALRTLNERGGWDSESGKQFHTSSGDLADAIDKARGRYEGTALALETYATDLDAVQATADGYLSAADAAGDDVREATHRVLPGAPGSPEYLLADTARKKDLAAALAVITTNKNNIYRLTEAGGEWSTINQRAANAIRTSSDDDLTDQWYEGIKQWVHDARGWLNAIKDILSVIGTILAVAVLIAILFIPGANIAALLILGVIVAGISSAITLAQFGAGDATGRDVVFSLASLAISCIGLGATGAAVTKITSKLTVSISHSAGYAARAAGGTYTAGYQATKAAATNVSLATRTFDELLGGGIAELVSVRAAGSSAKATGILLSGLRAGAWPAAVASSGTYLAGKDLFEVAGNVGAIVSGDYVRNLSRVHVGSL